MWGTYPHTLTNEFVVWLFHTHLKGAVVKVQGVSCRIHPIAMLVNLLGTEILYRLREELSVFEFVGYFSFRVQEKTLSEMVA